MNINYDWYKIFCCVAEHESITLASEKLFISQPAVSQSISRLEETVGCALFIRTPKGVKLTSEGRLLYQYASAGVASFSEGEHRLTAMLRLDIGEISIGASDMTLEFCLLPYLEEFHKKYPNINISITNNPTPQTLELLKQGKIDFAAVSGPMSTPELDIFPVRQIQDIFISSDKIEATKADKISDLNDHLILLESNTSTRHFLDNEFRKRGFVAIPKFELATSSQIVSFAARNMGIGCVVSDFAKTAIANGEVYEIKVSDPLPPRQIYVAQGTNLHSKAADELLKMILSKQCEARQIVFKETF